MGGYEETRLFEAVAPADAGQVLHEVHRVLVQKGYDPVQQIVGYLLSGDPTYITREVRGILRSVTRDDILEKLVEAYIGKM